MNIDELRKRVNALLLDTTRLATSGALEGLPIQGLRKLDRPISRTYSDGIAFEVDCTEQESVEIVLALDPVDFARLDDTATLFVWYVAPGEYPKLWRVKERAASLKAALQAARETEKARLDYYRKTGFLPGR